MFFIKIFCFEFYFYKTLVCFLTPIKPCNRIRAIHSSLELKHRMDAVVLLCAQIEFK